MDQHINTNQIDKSVNLEIKAKVSLSCRRTSKLSFFLKSRSIEYKFSKTADNFDILYGTVVCRLFGNLRPIARCVYVPRYLVVRNGW